MNSTLRAEVEAWIADDPDPKTAAELQTLLDAGDEVTLQKYFNGFLQFGTAGLRGPIGPGPSCMNRAVVGRAAAGIASYMQKRGMTKVVIGRDARYGSEDYTFETAEIMSGAGMDVYILPRPLPTPVLAFATSYLACDIGIMVTASHNPPQDNGYKVYVGPEADGVKYASSQIINPTDGFIAADIDAVTSLKSRAFFKARSMAPGSSGLGKATVGKSGSGVHCSSTVIRDEKPALLKTSCAVSVPTPCIAV